MTQKQSVRSFHTASDFSSTFAVENKLQVSGAVKQRRLIMFISENGEEKLSKPAMLERNSTDGQKDSEDLPNFLSSELPARRLFAT